MEIRRWHYYVIFNCVIIKYLEAKTISLNDVITAESQQKGTIETTLPQKFAAGTGKRYSLIKRLRSPLRIKNFLDSGFFRDHTPLGGNILSPLKYKKKYLIKSPLKPRKLKLIQKSRYKRKNQSTKREINGNEELNHKYIPLLKSLSMLFDNLLDSDSSESYVKTKKYKRNRFYSGETFEAHIPRSTHRSDSESESQEETVTFSQTLATAISITTETPTTTTTEAATTTANIITTRDLSPLRHNKNVPVLHPRNTSSSRGDDHGIGERSRATLHGNIEGNITRHLGDHEHAAGCRENESCAEDDEKNTHGVTRNGARGFRLPRPTGTRNDTGLFPKRNRTNNETHSQTESTDDHNRENQFKTGRNETESRRILQEPIRRLRGFILPKDINKNTEFVQAKEVREESFVNDTLDNASYQRVTDGGSPIAKEIQKVRTGTETKMIMNGLNFTSQSNTPKKKSPVMMIFDGYSIVKHKNGQNKFAEKSIRIHA